MPVILICKYEPCSTPFPVDSSRQGKARFCSVPCMSAGYKARSLSLFWKKVQVCEHGIDCPYCCWPWMGETQNIYRNVTIHGKQTSANRAAWEMWHKRAMHPELEAAHYCHFRPCCNPMHLHDATPKENAADSVRDNRRPSGEKHPNSKLTDALALEAFRLRDAGWKYADIAAYCHVSKSTIAFLLTGAFWKHISPPRQKQGH